MLTQAQKDIVANVIAQYADVKGDYASTMLEGIWHGYCDSGILTDALSVKDAERLTQYFTAEGLAVASLEMLNTFMLEADNEELECVQAINLLATAQTDNVDLEMLCAYMQEQI
jgi:hypothetical protein